MLTSFEAISLYAVLSGLSGLAIGSRVFPSARALDKAWSDGRRRGQGEVSRDVVSRARNGRVYRLGPHGEPGWCDAGSQWDRDGANAYYGWEMGGDDDGAEAAREAGPGQSESAGGEPPGSGSEHSRGPAGADRPADGPAAGVDWADELGGIRTQIAVDDATEVLAAQPDPPTPGSFEYYASDWQQKFDQWLAGEMAELAKQRRRYERV